MKSPALTSLIDVPIALIVSNKDTLPFRPGSGFRLPVVLVIQGERTLSWSQQNPLNLSYRWLTEDGELLEPDGRRTAIPTPLLPGSRVELEMEGTTPEDEGCYQLKLSLVLEGVHWAYDVESDGWVQRLVNVTPAPAWPTDLENSRGGRALRGAMVAAELARHLEKRSFAVKALPTETVTTTPSEVSLTDEPKSLLHPLRDWLRAMLGVRGLEQQLVDVIALARSQDRRARELETHILTIEEDLQVNLKMSNDRANRSREKLAATRYDDGAPPIALGAASRKTVTNVSQPTLPLSKEPPKKPNKISRKAGR